MSAFVLAQFPDEESLYAAARALRAIGHDDLDAHSPYPLHGIAEALGLRRSPIPMMVGLGAATGATVAYVMQWWCNAVDYRLNVGGRPPQSPPAFIPITFELAVLFGAFAAFVGTLFLAKLPRPHHPVFEVDAFRSASHDELWLSVAQEGAPDPEVQRTLERLGGRQLAVVEVKP